MRRLLWILPLLGLTSSLLAAELRVAVAANFYQAAQAVAGQFETKTGHRVVLIPGSTGKHYAQIINGAPFDVFLAADAERPLLLEQKGFSVPGTRHVYAHGRIVLWSRDPGRIDSHGGVLKTGGYRHLAIADPKLAPYGRAAQQALKALGVWQENETHIVYGKNINQVYQFASSGNAELGVIAASQIAGNTTTGSLWVISSELYEPIEQQLILLRDTSAGSAFIRHMLSPQTQLMIIEFGYNGAKAK